MIKSILILFVLTFSLISIIFPTQSYAIIVIVPLILIPVAKVVGIIIATLAIPFITSSAIYAKIKNKRAIKYIFISIVFLLLFAVSLAIILKILNPERPLI